MKKNNLRKILWATLVMFLGVLFTSSMFQVFDLDTFLGLESNQALVSRAPKVLDSKPKYFYLNQDSNGGPKVSAKAFLVGDLNTGEIIVSKNQEEIMPLASITKLMTAFVATEINTKNNIVEVSKNAIATHGTNGELRAGEKIAIEELLFPLLLESSNDAAEALAEHFDRDSFMQKMNQEAEILKMEGTSYEDPSGLSENNRSTVADIFKLAGFLFERRPELLSITNARSYATKKHTWSNISQFIGDSNYRGGKSGYTDAALQTVVSIFDLPLSEVGTRPIAIVLLRSTDRERDVRSILKYLEKNIYYGGAADATTNWVEEKVGLPDIKDPNFVILTFAGDIMLDRGVRNSVVKNFGNDYFALFQKSEKLLEAFQTSDIVFANLEGTASDKGVDQKSLYSFRMDPGVIPALRSAGINVLSVANNHVGDWGRAAYIDTLARLKENEIIYTGGGLDRAEAERVAIIDKYDMKIGFLGFSDKGPVQMKAGTESAGILLASDPQFEQIIEKAAKEVDFLIVSFHFGEEYEPLHDARQEDLAHKAVDNGAKIVIGHHPHVIEDTEVYKDGYIAYSLGNFIFDQSWSKPTMEGMLLKIKLNRDGTMSVTKNTTKQNSAFQIEQFLSGKEEKIEFNP